MRRENNNRGRDFGSNGRGNKFGPGNKSSSSNRSGGSRFSNDRASSNRFAGNRSGGQRRFNDGPKEMHKTVCADCGKECEVPFKTTGERPVYCRDCFAKHKPANRF